MSEEMRLTVEITDTHEGADRRVSIDIVLPTEKGSEGPALDGVGWEDGVVRLVQCVTLAASGAAYDSRTAADLKYLGSTPTLVNPSQESVLAMRRRMYDASKKIVERYERDYLKEPTDA